MFHYKYPRAALTADVVLIDPNSDEGTRILCIRRKHYPFEGQWALPGGFLDEGETPIAAAVRELQEETGVKIRPSELHLIDVFAEPGRDPREHVISVAYWGITPTMQIQANDDAAEVAWICIRDWPSLAFDHSDIARRALHLHQEAGYRLW